MLFLAWILVTFKKNILNIYDIKLPFIILVQLIMRSGVWNDPVTTLKHVLSTGMMR